MAQALHDLLTRQVARFTDRVGDWDAFAAQTLALLSDSALWASASAAGIELTRREFAPDVLARRLAHVLGSGGPD